MLTRIQTGTTDWNNTQRLGAGELTFDEEAKALRLHDNKTLGGFEVLGEQAYTPILGPGPIELMYGDPQRGFYGRVSESDLITADDLRTVVGMSTGTSQTDVTWLKFAYQEKVLFYPDKRITITASWNLIYELGLVYGTNDVGLYPTANPTNQDTQITIGDWVYRVRLIKGADTDPYTGGDTTNAGDSQTNSEWNQLIYPLMDGTWETANSFSYDIANGRDVWCQETAQGDTSSALLRGNTLSAGFIRGKTQSANSRSWRPVLELVGKAMV